MLVFPIASLFSRPNFMIEEISLPSIFASLAFTGPNIRSKSRVTASIPVPWLTNTRCRDVDGAEKDEGSFWERGGDAGTNEGAPDKTPDFRVNVNTRSAFRGWHGRVHVRIHSRSNNSCKSDRHLWDEFEVFLATHTGLAVKNIEM